jgi:hypothetical protein
VPVTTSSLVVMKNGRKGREEERPANELGVVMGPRCPNKRASGCDDASKTEVDTAGSPSTYFIHLINAKNVPNHTPIFVPMVAMMPHLATLTLRFNNRCSTGTSHAYPEKSTQVPTARFYCTDHEHIEKQNPRTSSSKVPNPPSNYATHSQTRAQQ